jgi:hypothetical protein
MKNYVFGARNGIYIIDLQKTVEHTRAACTFAAKVTAEGKKVLFVGTKKQARDAVKDAADKMTNLNDKADFDKAVATLKDVRDEADGEAKKNWDTVVTSFEAMEDGDVDGVDTAAVEKAGKSLEKQVKDECDIDLTEIG